MLGKEREPQPHVKGGVRRTQPEGPAQMRLGGRALARGQ
jgi:hypothetical protein